MSRIHEALKKAELERAGTEAATVEVPAGAEGFVRPVERAASSSAPMEAPLTVERLLEGVRKVNWRPEPRTALLFGPTFQGEGSEELRRLRTRLYQMRDQQPLRTLLISSAVPGEGKTFLTANLANMISRQHERRALIIDADLRRSQMHQVLGAPPVPGLMEYLSGQADEMSVIQQGPNRSLFLIPGGKPASNPAELLGNGRMKLLLDRVAPLFDWVLVDSPPILPVADSRVLASICDGVLLVVLAASTPADLAQKARSEFNEHNVVGVILNQAENSHHGSYYYQAYKGDKDKGSSHS